MVTSNGLHRNENNRDHLNIINYQHWSSSNIRFLRHLSFALLLLPGPILNNTFTILVFVLELEKSIENLSEGLNFFCSRPWKILQYKTRYTHKQTITTTYIPCLPSARNQNSEEKEKAEVLYRILYEFISSLLFRDF